MRSLVDNARHSRPAKAILLGTAALFLAGCSTEMSRIGGSMFGETHTGSVTPAEPVAGGQAYAGANADAPRGTVESQPLTAPGQGQSGGYAAAQPSESGSVVVGGSDTVYSIARRYGIPPNALMEANGISDPNAVSPGQRLAVPTYSASTGKWEVRSQAAAGQPSPAQQAPMQQIAPQQAATQASPQQAPASGGGTHTVRHGDTVYSIARAYNARPNDIISANGLDSPNNIRIGQTLRVPGASGAASAGGQPPAQETQSAQVEAPLDSSQAMEQKPQTVETAEEVTPAALAPAGGESQQEQTRAALPDPETMSGGQFRWPVRGRVIAGFGESSEGGKNDGINISVPEGTSVRAAENGVVAYAGNELQGYGNLVLVRHSDDWVSAYAHNSEILVSRGDSVTRGQVIAKAGASGSVSSPQVHFELRKGSQPVDPLRHLAEN